ncbi:MAG: hypothetical protein ACMXX9_04715 [Candidatus Woesearchaeota archaeon]
MFCYFELTNLGGVDVLFLDLLVDDPKKRRPDISKAKEVIGYDPKIKLHEGLKRTISYFKSIV